MSSTRGVNPWIVTISVMLATFMEVLDTTVVNVSLPHISGNLGSTYEEGTWVVTSYLVSNAIILPMSGWLANRFGRRRLLILCVAGFAVSSLMCGLATNLTALVVFRVLQGLTGGGMTPFAQATMLESFPPEKHGQAMAAYGLGIIIAPILGPTLGGWITDNYSWRWIFYINVPVGILSVALISRFVHDPAYIRKAKTKVDAWGIGLLAVGLGALQIILDTGQRKDWFGSDEIRIYTVVCVVSLLALIIRELVVDAPIVDIRALKDTSFATGVFLITIVGFILYGSLVILPMFLQNLLGYPAMTSGLALSPRGIGALIMMPIAGILVSRVNPKILLATGFALLAVSLASLSYLNLDTGYWNICWPQVTQGVAMAFIWVPLTNAALSHVPKQKMGNATSIYNLMRNIGGSLGIAAMQTFISRRQQFHSSRLGEHVVPQSMDVQSLYSQMVHFFVTKGSDAYTASRQAYAALNGMVQKQAEMLSFVEAFWIMTAVAICTMPLLLLLSNPHAERKAQTLKASPPKNDIVVENGALLAH